jgi:hypothetical protein
MIKETPLTLAQENEFTLNRLGYYCKVRSVWNQAKYEEDADNDLEGYSA